MAAILAAFQKTKRLPDPGSLIVQAAIFLTSNGYFFSMGALSSCSILMRSNASFESLNERKTNKPDRVLETSNWSEFPMPKKIPTSCAASTQTTIALTNKGMMSMQTTCLNRNMTGLNCIQRKAWQQ